MVVLFIQFLTTGQGFQNQFDQRDAIQGRSIHPWVSQWHKEGCVRDVRSPGSHFSVHTASVVASKENISYQLILVLHLSDWRVSWIFSRD